MEIFDTVKSIDEKMAVEKGIIGTQYEEEEEDERGGLRKIGGVRRKKKKQCKRKRKIHQLPS